MVFSSIFQVNRYISSSSTSAIIAQGGQQQSPIRPPYTIVAGESQSPMQPRSAHEHSDNARRTTIFKKLLIDYIRRSSNSSVISRAVLLQPGELQMQPPPSVRPQVVALTPASSGSEEAAFASALGAHARYVLFCTWMLMEKVWI